MNPVLRRKLRQRSEADRIRALRQPATQIARLYEAARLADRDEARRLERHLLDELRALPEKIGRHCDLPGDIRYALGVDGQLYRVPTPPPIYPGSKWADALGEEPHQQWSRRQQAMPRPRKLLGPGDGRRQR